MEAWDVLETENAKKKESLGLVEGTDNNSNGHVESVSTPVQNFSDPKKSQLGIIGVKSRDGGKASSGLFSSYKQRQRKVDDSPSSSGSSSVFGSIRSFLGISRSEGKVAPNREDSRRPFSASFSEGQDKPRSRTSENGSSTNSLQSERSRASSYSGSDVQVGAPTSSGDELGGTALKSESEANSVPSKNSASPRRHRKTDPPRSRRALFVDAPMRLEYKHEPAAPSDATFEEDRHVFLVSSANGINSSKSRPESGYCSTDEQAANHRDKYHKHYEIVISPETSTSSSKNKSIVNENAVGNNEHAVARTVKQVHQSLVPIVGLGLIDETNSRSVLKSPSDHRTVEAKGSFILGHCASLDLEDRQALNHPNQTVLSLDSTTTSLPAPKILNHDHASPSSGSDQMWRETGCSLDNTVFISSRSENALAPCQLHKQEIPVEDFPDEGIAGNVCVAEDLRDTASKTDKSVEESKAQNALVPNTGFVSHLDSIMEHPGESSPSPLEDSMNSFERHEHEFGLDSADVSPYEEFPETDFYIGEEETCPDRKLTSELLKYMPSIIEAEQEIVSSGEGCCNGNAEEGHYGAAADNAEWVAVLKPLLVDPEVVAHIYLRLANAFFVHATSKYDDRQVWIGRSIYLIVVNNKLCNFAHVINHLLSFMGLIKSERHSAPSANVPSLLYFLEKLLRSFRIEHVRILSCFFARPNTVLTNYHDARVGLLKACFLAELAAFASTGPEYLLVAFTAIAEYFVMLDSHVAENLTSQYLLPYLPKHATQFVIHVLCYMGLLHSERPVQVVGDLTASLLLLRFVCRHAQLPSIERDIFLAILTRPHVKFDLCDDERMEVIGLLDASSDRSSRLA